MTNEWDTPYNTGSITIEQQMHEQQRRWDQEEETRERRLGHFEIPAIENEVVRQNFPRWVNQQPDEYSPYIARWAANRTVWICHNCGSFGYKYSQRELFKCYSCRSRNVQVCKAGELSLVMRTSNIMPGVNMEQVYQARRARQRQRRSDERAIRNSVHAR
jgi:hypothetical protein